MGPIKLVIDTDPGIDDAMAIFLAAVSADIELLGLTTIFGNVTTDIATRNALRLLEAAGDDAPVAPGAAMPWGDWPFEPSWEVHGREGFGDIEPVTPVTDPVGETAAELLTRLAREFPGELVVCPLGPLTNLADALGRDPDFAGNVARIGLLAASLDEGGNITPYAEANIYHDPQAAEAVFASGAPVEMVGLDVTHRVTCTEEDFDQIAETSPELGGMLKRMSEYYLKFYRSVGKLDGCSLHDPAAIIACTHPHLFETRDVPIRVVTSGEEAGRTEAAEDGRKPTKVCVAVQGPEVKQLFLDRLAQLP
jgi:inosine-uridine nucleoside N-ribohydrolase